MLIKLIRTLMRDRKGGTVIEYGLIVALIVISMVAAFIGLANATTSMWGNVSTKVQSASNG